MNGSPFPEGHAAVPPERVIFEIGSISKVFTAFLLADAVKDGKLALSDTLAQRFPAVKFQDPAVGAITLEHLATHSSCLPRLPSNFTQANGPDPYSQYDDIALFEYLAAAKLDAQPPCEVAYSNLGFGLLGVVVERAQGKPWASLVQEKIAGPLGMVDTVQVLSADQLTRLADPWAGDKRSTSWTFKAMAGAGALRSTLADMSRFADALQSGSSGPLGPTWPLVSADRADMPSIGGKMGLGLLHAKEHGDDVYMHDGETGGYGSLLRVTAASGECSILLASNASATPAAWIASWKSPAAAPAARTEIALATEVLDEYVGVYPIDAAGRFTFVRHGAGLVARLTGQGFAPIFASAKDEFFFKIVDAQIRFRRGATGSIEGVTLHQNGREIPATRAPGPAPHIEFPEAPALAELAGQYDFSAFMPGGIFTVKPGPGALLVELTGQPAILVFCTEKDRFEYEVVPAALSFERDAAGRVIALTLHQGGMDMRAPRK